MEEENNENSVVSEPPTNVYLRVTRERLSRFEMMVVGQTCWCLNDELAGKWFKGGCFLAE